MVLGRLHSGSLIGKSILRRRAVLHTDLPPPSATWMSGHAGAPDRTEDRIGALAGAMQESGSGSTTRAGRVPNWGYVGRAGLARRLRVCGWRTEE